MANVSKISTASASATTVTPGTHASGDILIIFAYRDGSATPPTLPAGWTEIRNRGGTSNSFRVGYKVASGSSETSGTWTNATELICVVLRTQSTAAPIGFTITNDGVSTTVNYGANDMINTDGSGYLLAFAGHRSTDTTLETAPTGMTNIVTLADATAEVAAHELVGGTSWASTNVSVGGTSSGWCTVVIEINSTNVVAKTTLTAAGTTTHTTNASTTKGTVQAWGGGGSGGKGADDASGGGGGALSQKNNITLSPSTGYTAIVGAGGAGKATNGTGNVGGDSSFVDTSTVLAKGGAGGLSGVTVAGVSGGASASGVGDYKFSGGNSGSATGTWGSGGGAGAGDSAAGGSSGNASSGNTAGGTAGVFGGGAGSAGNDSANTAAGTAPGGASGGAAFGGGNSGAGAAGQLIIWEIVGTAETITPDKWLGITQPRRLEKIGAVGY